MNVLDAVMISLLNSSLFVLVHTVFSIAALVFPGG